jgi:hypothetical protein
LAPQPLEALATIEEGMLIWFLWIFKCRSNRFTIVKNCKSKTNIILTIPQFALQSYDAIDYLLKPFEFERFYEQF